MNMRWKKIKKQYLVIILAVVILILPLWMSLYGVLPFLEKHPSSKYCGYVLFSPIEFLRVNSLPVYRYTEVLYETMGGKVSSVDRCNSDEGVRRTVWFRKNGSVRNDLHSTFYGANTLRGWWYYPNGKLQQKVEGDKAGHKMQFYYESGEVAMEDKFNRSSRIIEYHLPDKSSYRYECINDIKNGTILEWTYGAIPKRWIWVTYKDNEVIKTQPLSPTESALWNYVINSHP